MAAVPLILVSCRNDLFCLLYILLVYVTWILEVNQCRLKFLVSWFWFFVCFLLFFVSRIVYEMQLKNKLIKVQQLWNMFLTQLIILKKGNKTNQENSYISLIGFGTHVLWSFHYFIPFAFRWLWNSNLEPCFCLL